MMRCNLAKGYKFYNLTCTYMDHSRSFISHNKHTPKSKHIILHAIATKKPKQTIFTRFWPQRSNPPTHSTLFVLFTYHKRRKIKHLPPLNSVFFNGL